MFNTPGGLQGNSGSAAGIGSEGAGEGCNESLSDLNISERAPSVDLNYLSVRIQPSLSKGRISLLIYATTFESRPKICPKSDSGASAKDWATQRGILIIPSVAECIDKVSALALLRSLRQSPTAQNVVLVSQLKHLHQGQVVILVDVNKCSVQLPVSVGVGVVSTEPQPSLLNLCAIDQIISITAWDMIPVSNTSLNIPSSARLVQFRFNASSS